AGSFASSSSSKAGSMAQLLTTGMAAALRTHSNSNSSQVGLGQRAGAAGGGMASQSVGDNAPGVGGSLLNQNRTSIRGGQNAPVRIGSAGPNDAGRWIGAPPSLQTAAALQAGAVHSALQHLGGAATHPGIMMIDHPSLLHLAGAVPGSASQAGPFGSHGILGLSDDPLRAMARNPLGMMKGVPSGEASLGTEMGVNAQQGGILQPSAVGNPSASGVGGPNSAAHQMGIQLQAGLGGSTAPGGANSGVYGTSISGAAATFINATNNMHSLLVGPGSGGAFHHPAGPPYAGATDTGLNKMRIDYTSAGERVPGKLVQQTSNGLARTTGTGCSTMMEQQQPHTQHVSLQHFGPAAESLLNNAGGIFGQHFNVQGAAGKGALHPAAWLQATQQQHNYHVAEGGGVTGTSSFYDTTMTGSASGTRTGQQVVDATSMSGHLDAATTTSSTMTPSTTATAPSSGSSSSMTSSANQQARRNLIKGSSAYKNFSSTGAGSSKYSGGSTSSGGKKYEGGGKGSF
ncbi:unnamed protein product, partial [Amoebophrya sp. A25]